METTTEQHQGKLKGTQSGVNLAHVNEPCLSAALAHLGVRVAAGASVPRKVEALVAHFEEKKCELMDCDVCGGGSDVDLTACPFCNDGQPGVPEAFARPAAEERTSEETTSAPVAPPAPPSEAALPAEEPEPAPAAEAAPAPPAESEVVAGKAARSTRKKKGAEQGTLDLDATVKPTPAPAPLAKANGHANGHANGKAHAPAPLAKAEERAPAARGGTPLDRALGEIREILIQGERGFRAASYRIGKKLWEVHEKDLWKLRKSESGGVAYKTFGQFLSAEVSQISERYAFELMRVACAFTEEQFLTHGTKLIAVAKVDNEEVRERLLEQAKGGASIRALLHEAKKNKPAKAKDAKHDHSRTQKQKAPAPDKVTVVSTVGTKHTSKAYKKGQTAEAKRLSDTPWGFFDLTNDVRVFATLVETASGLRFKFSVERVKTEKAEAEKAPKKK